jgi:hypothetical protein
MTHLPKYALLEIERRWRVPQTRLAPLTQGAHTLIDDLYVDGVRLRVRAMALPDGTRQFKLRKKYAQNVWIARSHTTKA